MLGVLVLCECSAMIATFSPRSPSSANTGPRSQIISPCEVKVHPVTPWGPKRGSRGIALPFCEPQHEEGMGWLVPHPGRLTRRKETRYPLYRRLGGPQGRSGWLRKMSPPPGLDARTVQPVASRYTDCAILAHYFSLSFIKMFIAWKHVSYRSNRP
jgi:hypothetical protein